MKMLAPELSPATVFLEPDRKKNRQMRHWRSPPRPLDVLENIICANL